MSASILFLAAAFLYALYALSHWKALSIQSVEIYGADDDTRSSLQATALLALRGNHLGILSKSNVFLYPKAGIEREVRSASLAIDAVEVERKGRSLSVSIREKAPSALICASLPDFSADNDACHFADGSGKIFKEAPTFSNGVYNRYFIPGLLQDEPQGSPIGMYAASTTKFTELQTFYDMVKDAGMRAEAILVTDDGGYELYVTDPDSASSGGNGDSRLIVIYLSDKRPLKEQAINLISFWNDAMESARISDTKPAFESIDVRYGSNVFYRLIK